MLSASIISGLEYELSQYEEKNIRIEKTIVISGGSINQSFRLLTSNGDYFVKLNSMSRFPSMFQNEKEGLELLSSNTELKVPIPMFYGDKEDSAFLVMEYIDSKEPKKHFWEQFGRGLAEMHKISSGHHFGLKKENYIGTLKQQNDWKGSWVNFFIENRLEIQGKSALENGLIDKKTYELLQKLYQKLENIFPVESSSLLHGDLWSGNYMVGSKGEAVIMDPAVYYGNREMDIAMTYLFGGFESEFYESYNEHFPLQAGWENRIEICNLYPLLVHVNLFGASYASRVRSILKRLA